MDFGMKIDRKPLLRERKKALCDGRIGVITPKGAVLPLCAPELPEQGLKVVVAVLPNFKYCPAGWSGCLH